jgi:twinkle protein
MTKNWINYLFAGPRNVKQYSADNGAVYYRVTQSAKEQINDKYRGLCHLYRDDFDNDVEALQTSMTDAARKYGCKLFIIDNLMTVNLHADDSNKYDKQTEFVNWLIHFSAKFSVCTILVCHPRKLQFGQEDLDMYDVAGSSNLVNLAHRGFGLKRIHKKEKEGRRNKRGDGWEVPPCPYDVKLTVLKDRLRGRANFELGMYYDEKSRRFFSSPEEYDRQYSWDTKVYTNEIPYPVVDQTDEVYGVISKS